MTRSVGINAIQDHGRMTAKIGDVIVGEETPLSQQSSLMGLIKDDNIIPKTIITLINRFKDIFTEKAKEHILTEPMSISLISNRLVKARLKEHSAEDLVDIREQLDSLLTNGIIEPSNSPFSSNARLVPKKNGQKRLVVNFIALNAITKKDNYPIPRINDLFNSLRGAKYFCALDCTEGFHQILMSPEDRHKTAFVTPFGLFHYTRCPFGLTNSPAVFQRTMNRIFHEGLYTKCVNYIDDFVVFGKSLKELETNLEWMVGKCAEYNVKLKLSKCVFAKESVAFLGFCISHNKIAPVPGKCDPISLISPQRKTDVLSILGTLNYYSRFIENFAEKTKPLINLTRKDKEFEWRPEYSLIIKDLQNDLKKAFPQEIPVRK